MRPADIMHDASAELASARDRVFKVLRMLAADEEKRIGHVGVRTQEAMERARLYRACADWLERRGDEEGRS